MLSGRKLEACQRHSQILYIPGVVKHAIHAHIDGTPTRAGTGRHFIAQRQMIGIGDKIQCHRGGGNISDDPIRVFFSVDPALLLGEPMDMQAAVPVKGMVQGIVHDLAQLRSI